MPPHWDSTRYNAVLDGANGDCRDACLLGLDTHQCRLQVVDVRLYRLPSSVKNMAQDGFQGVDKSLALQGD